MDTKPIEHEISEAWRRHIQETLTTIQRRKDDILRLQGQIHLAEQDIGHMQNHLSVLCGQIPKAEHVPESLAPWRLSEDGTKLIGEIEVETKKPSP